MFSIGSSRNRAEIIIEEDRKIVADIEELVAYIEKFIEEEKNAPEGDIRADVEIGTEKLREQLLEVTSEVEKLDKDIHRVSSDEVARELSEHGLEPDEVDSVLQQLENLAEEVEELENAIETGKTENPFKAFVNAAREIIQSLRKDEQRLGNAG